MTSYQLDISRRMLAAGMAAASATPAWTKTKPRVLALVADGCHNPHHLLAAERFLSH
jgi:hypothetical protein